MHRGGGSVSASTPRCGGNKINQGGAETDRDAMGNGEGYPLPIRQGLLGERRKLLQRGPWRSPDQNDSSAFKASHLVVLLEVN